MSQFSMWTRTILVLSVALWAGRCAESPGVTGTADADVSGLVDVDDVLAPDSSLDADVSEASDIGVGDAAENEVDADDVADAVEISDSADAAESTDAVDATDNSDPTDSLGPVDVANDGSGAAVDTGDAVDAGDIVDTGDAGPDAAAELGTPCVTDGECASGECFDVAGGGVAGLCSNVCVEADECAEGFDCTLVTLEGAEAEGRCLPVDYCADGDGDGFGVGPACRGLDCNDDDFTVNIDAVEVCDGVDNDCDGIADDNIAGVGDDCSTGSEGVCAPGRTQCVGGEVRCIAFASPVEEVCDGLDNDCDGSADEGVLLEGYRVVDGVCVLVTCGAVPAAPANAALVSVSSTQFGGEVVFACDAGYVLSAGALSRICDASGSWAGDAAVCTPVDCGALSDPENGDVVVAAGTSLGATASYTCVEGYALSGSATLTCDVTGAWSGSAPSCAPTSCGAVATVANATASVPSALFGSTATFTCDVGFVQRAGTANTQACAGAAWVWSGTVLSCDPVSCGPLGNPANGTVATPDGIAYADVATYTCNSGFTLTGSSTRTCQLSGVWSGAAPGCAPVDCGAPPTTTNGTRTFTSTTYTSVASYACAEGYTLTGSASSTCTATGTWTTAPTCVAVPCGALGGPANGSVSTPTGVEYTDVATYACAVGYQINGAATRTCLATGLWSGVAATCADINECVPAGSVCTAANNVCTNTVGSWECSCAEDYIGTTVTGGNATCTLVPASPGAACTDDSECPSNSWCSTVSGYRRCSPRVFTGVAHQMDFVFVPLGTFQQGTLGATNEERPYTATISRNYFVSRTEVTQGQWKAATGGTNGSCFQSTTGTRCTTSSVNNTGPVELVDWYSTLAYANWLSVNQGLSSCYTLSGCTDATSGWHDGQHSGCTGATFVGLTCTGYRLLTESEWERAARGNTTSTYYWGTATDTATVGLYAWFSGNAGSRTQSVGGKQTNAFGLHDMSGNVWEWVWDWFATAYPSGSATDYIGPSSGSARGIRGGGWNGGASVLRSAVRRGSDPSDRVDFVGFRLARTAN